MCFLVCIPLKWKHRENYRIVREVKRKGVKHEIAAKEDIKEEDWRIN